MCGELFGAMSAAETSCHMVLLVFLKSVGVNKAGATFKTDVVTVVYVNMFLKNFERREYDLTNKARKRTFAEFEGDDLIFDIRVYFYVVLAL